jgi:hypothetical protein
MKGVELYAQVRFAVQIEGLSRRAAARRYGIDPRTVAKMLAFLRDRREINALRVMSPYWRPASGAQRSLATAGGSESDTLSPEPTSSKHTIPSGRRIG